MSDAPLLGRQIRVFVSSTFRDMQTDRDELVKKVFPQLRKLCESRAVTWTEVDLRWGITSEQQAEGKVLPYCLAEIERSRPFFIGLLGERYGWVPQSIPAELLEQQPWLREHLEHSVTELEILHGVLNNPAMAERALFYFRDPAYAAAVPAEKKDDFVETEPDAERMRKKLANLKQRIRTAALEKKLKYAPRENYPNPDALGALILADFTEIINELYPPHEVPDPLDQEAARHEEYARSRRDLYIARRRYFEILDRHVESPNPPLVLTGESGSGKTALLANWIERYRESRPQDLAIQHYIGSTPDSADWMRVVSRILGELKRGFNLSDELPATPEKLRSALDEWLVKTASGRRIVLVLDGLNQLEDRDNAQDLAWLPRVFPTNVRVLAASLPGKAFDATQRRQWPTKAVELLNGDERRQIVTGYLALGGRTASKELLSAIEAQPQTLNPLYLRAFLDEIRVIGRFEELPTTVEKYLRAAAPSDLYRLIIQRWVGDYPEARVADALRLVWAARRGLAEAELMDLLGQDGQPLPMRYWTPFYLVAERSLAMRAGLLNFGHDYLRAAVQQEVLSNEASQKSIRLQLAGYFREPAASERAVAERPWQLLQLEEWDRLLECVTNIPAFLLSYRSSGNLSDWLRYCSAIEKRFDLVEEFGRAVRQFEENSPATAELADALHTVGSFLAIGVSIEMALPVIEKALALRERTCGELDVLLPARLRSIARIYLEHSMYFTGAEPFLRRAVELSEKLFGPDSPETGFSLSDLAFLLIRKGDYGAATDALQQALTIAEAHRGRMNLAKTRMLNNLAIVYSQTGRRAKAEQLFREVLETQERLLQPTDSELGVSLENLGRHLAENGKRFEATLLLLRARKIYDTTFGPWHTYTKRVNREVEELLHGKGLR